LLLLAILVWLVYPFIERYIDSQRDPAGEQEPGRLELPPASELVRDGNLLAATDGRNDPAAVGRSDTYKS